MQPQVSTPIAPAALSDKELEVLRLLAAGHTVKSISGRLGRSEASINERLRDARRKTGIGSSRELARLLDAQKIWDRKIDLPPAASRADDRTPPANAGRLKLKGMIVMLVTLPLAAAGLLLMTADAVPPAALPHASLTAADAMPLAGRWSLDVMRVPAGERPQKVTISFAIAPDQKLTTLVDIVGADGSVQHAESTAALDGVAVPVAGNMGFIDTVSLRQPAPGTLVMTLGKNGAAVSTRVYAAAKDRQSMTETIIWPGQSIPRLETNHFKRIG